MIEISLKDVQNRLLFDNPWWNENGNVPYANLPERHYLESFLHLVKDRSVRRAVILMGPRRVGKTVMLFQAIGKLIALGTPPRSILFLSLETPIYTGLALEKFVHLFQDRFRHEPGVPLTIVFDEIQYLRDWEVHLKSLVDSYPKIRFIASGSAAAALLLKSRESGAGRFTEFLLPPLTFAEYLGFINKADALIEETEGNRDVGLSPTYRARDIDALNREFIEYLNIGGYPEAVFNEAVRQDRERYIKSDIIDKVLLRDLPQLYGIRDIQELNRLFTTLAYNTGNEVSLEDLSKSSGVVKTTLNRYIEYLEAAFLIRRVYRIDQNAKQFKRAMAFKVYLTNPTMRAALFGSLAEDDQSMGALAETALFSQWFHDQEWIKNIHYARWAKGEIDMVFLYPAIQKPAWCVEVKWSDRVMSDPAELRHLKAFLQTHPTIGEDGCSITTKTVSDSYAFEQWKIELVPTSLLVYRVGKNIVESLKNQIAEKLRAASVTDSLSP